LLAEVTDAEYLISSCDLGFIERTRIDRYPDVSKYSKLDLSRSDFRYATDFAVPRPIEEELAAEKVKL